MTTNSTPDTAQRLSAKLAAFRRTLQEDENLLLERVMQAANDADVAGYDGHGPRNTPVRPGSSLSLTDNVPSFGLVSACGESDEEILAKFSRTGSTVSDAIRDQ